MNIYHDVVFDFRIQHFVAAIAWTLKKGTRSSDGSSNLGSVKYVMVRQRITIQRDYWRSMSRMCVERDQYPQLQFPKDMKENRGMHAFIGPLELGADDMLRGR